MKIFVVTRDNGDRAERMSAIVKAFISGDDANDFAQEQEDEERKTSEWISFDVIETELEGINP